ncbi:protein of unknown function [Taphrina deformans PYCC 5710]|uniref:Uncharacterized protein n=1 Tax=Taphrina deformans (strain PYCC 5710 / ATCC 11124 / CBS 356.35 / IMI 108563 / JCM 9778 / NBRC 8474) TaxID=1097556 RepID=R4XDY2_TAPDE|nr:protein of unknown function [Taphrina deformans PYCC 5710]|eukprot:CCG83862.1 protein of unknown function [Taphrina deformans PYCC 5710]
MADSQSRLKLITTHLGGAPATSLADKVCIITGTNSIIGIGAATAKLFCARGAKAVYVCDYESNNLSDLKSQLNKKYPATDVIVREFDAADEAALKDCIQHATDTYGRLDIFFANAGIVTMNLVQNADAEDFMNTMRVNALSVFLAIKHASDAMKVTSAAKPVSSGSILATASVAGIRSGAGSSDYSASKAAVINLVQTSAWQLVGTGIRVNAICPGLIQSGMTQAVFDAAAARGTSGKIGQLNPTKRHGISEEIAHAALFLSCDEASYVNGVAFPVDGGLSASHPVVEGKVH